MNKIKTAVVGVGYLGHYHAQKYNNLDGSKLIAVCDINPDRCNEIAMQYETQAVHDYHSLANMVDAVSIAVPTPLHHKIAKFFLEHGVHVLLEKPISTTIEEADDLIRAAEKSGCLLQIGHLERFNNAVKAVEPVLMNPRFIDSLRQAQFKLRGSDVNVVLDLMIHDIDLIQSIVKSDITHISASGASVLSPYIDIANARIEFANGCAANVTASRVSLKLARQMRIFQYDGYIGLDLDRKNMLVHRKGTREVFPGIPEIIQERKRFDKGDALLDQIQAFLSSITNNKPPAVTGEDGKKALETAIKITNIVRHNNELHSLT